MQTNQKAKASGWSLRSKILFVLMILPILILGLYGGLAMSLFEKDKLAFVFESSQSVARTLAMQMEAQLNATMSVIQPILQERVLFKKFGLIAAGVFQSEKNLDWIALMEKGSSELQSWTAVDLFERKKGLQQLDLQAVPNFKNVLDQALEKGRQILNPWNSEALLLIEPLGEGRSQVFAVLIKLPQVFSAFRNPSSSQNILVNTSGQVLFGPADMALKNLSETIDPKLMKKFFDQNTSSTVRSLQDDELLVSSAKVATGGLTVFSLVAKEDALAVMRTLAQKSVLFMLLLLSASLIVGVLASNKLTRSLFDLFDATQKVAEGEFNIEVPVSSKDEIGNLAQSFNTMAFEVKRLMAETAEKARMQSELKTAQTVQETLFPEPHGKLPGVEVFGFYEPASECGGDWWNYSVVEEKVFLWIGDATGHGAPAALITSATKSAATMIEKMKVDPQTALTLLNQAIYDVSHGKIMMTFFLASLDPKTGIFTYSNASHEAPYLMKASSPVQKKTLIPLNEVADPRLGHRKDTVYSQRQIQLEKGDRILFFTDGIAEIQNNEQEAWGEREFLKSVVAANKEFPPVKKSIEMMIESWSGHRNHATLADDVTLFLCEYQGSTLSEGQKSA